jgi:type II secretory pathway predicted ATPase ExeA
MYEAHWQLEQKPFENCCDPQFYFPDESRQAALLKIRYAVENHRGGAILAGPPGTGKSLLVNMLRNSLGDEFFPLVHLVYPQMLTAELLAYLADELCGVDDRPTLPSLDRSVRRIQRYLTENTEQGRHAVVAIDEAHLLTDPETLEALRLLLNFELAGHPMLTLLLVGQASILPTLDRTPQLEERLAVKCLLRSLNARETAEYVAHRLHVAGAPGEIFEPEALAKLHELSQGVPRRINRLCDLALLIGFAEQCRRISAAQIETVSHEMVAISAE